MCDTDGGLSVRGDEYAWQFRKHLRVLQIKLVHFISHSLTCTSMHTHAQTFFCHQTEEIFFLDTIQRDDVAGELFRLREQQGQNELWP